MEKFKEVRRRSKGFTLIELLIVIALLSVIVGVMVNVFSGSTDEAKATKIEDTMRILDDASHRFKIDVGDFPSAVKQLWDGSGIPNWHGAYIRPQVTDSDGNIILKDVGSDVKVNVNCDETNKKFEIVVTNIPKSVAQAFDNKFDNGDLTKGKATYDEANKKLTIVVATGDIEPITCYSSY
jgi:general secretion pathway protein G